MLPARSRKQWSFNDPIFLLDQEYGFLKIIRLSLAGLIPGYQGPLAVQFAIDMIVLTSIYRIQEKLKGHSQFSWVCVRRNKTMHSRIV